MTIKSTYISYLLLCFLSLYLQKEIQKNETKNENNNYEISYKTEKLLASNFTINPDNEYYYEFRLVSMNFAPHDIFPAIYRVNLSALKDANQSYFAKVHFVDAVIIKF